MTTALTAARDVRGLRSADAAFLVATAASAVLAVPLVAVAGTKAVLAFFALAAVIIVAARPHWGAYLYLLATPLIVGIARGDSLPIRPNEALLGLIAIALAARIVALSLRGEASRVTIGRVERALMLMALCASVVPLAVRYGRGLPISADDLLYAVVLWKYVVVYRVFREAVRLPRQVAVCLWLSLASAAIVATVAILQVMNLFGVPEFLFAYYDDPFGSASGAGTDRGTSTIASSFGVADVMAINLAVVLAMLAAGHPRRGLLLAAGALFILGCIATGQFSGLIGLAIVAGSVTAMATRTRLRLAWVVPGAALAGVALWPVIAERLRGFDTLAGLPPSWVGRLNNLQQIVWPELFGGWNWVFGVRPAARIAAPEPWREWIFIESGYTWLMWTGGVPLLLAFGVFVGSASTELRRVIRDAGGPVVVAAVSSVAWLVAMSVLMLLDPHLTMRGAADLFFPLLALATAGCVASAEPRPANANRVRTDGTQSHEFRSRRSPFALCRRNFALKIKHGRRVDRPSRNGPSGGEHAKRTLSGVLADTAVGREPCGALRDRVHSSRRMQLRIRTGGLLCRRSAGGRAPLGDGGRVGRRARAAGARATLSSR
jgi:hypothetical protein